MKGELNQKPEAVKMLASSFINLAKRHGYKAEVFEDTIRCEKKVTKDWGIEHSVIYADFCIFSKDKVSNFEGFSSSFADVLKMRYKMTYVWELNNFIRHHD